MRTLFRFATVAALTSVIVSCSPAAASDAASTPCTAATSACEHWVTLGGGPARSMVYATYPLDRPNPSITRALIMVHGAARNADHYFETATAAAFLAGALGNTIVIAPHFIDRRDSAAANEIVWPEGHDSWRSGGMSPSNPTLSSFDLMDEIVRELANKKTFPNLTKVVIAGHSAGGQFATRYEMANKIDNGSLGVSMSYVVANPSSYAWPAAVRPLPTGDANPETAVQEAMGREQEKVHTDFSYGPFDSAKAPRYDQWPMGLEDRTSGYTAHMTDAQLKKQLVERPATYLLGQVDVLPLGGFDSSPSAMAQGPTRRARGEAFVKYVDDSLGAKHKAIIVPECGHNDRCIYTTDIVFPVIFPQ
jgi:pimeloyl-ACP methyl ester carboxylesterase